MIMKLHLQVLGKEGQVLTLWAASNFLRTVCFSQLHGYVEVTTGEDTANSILYATNPSRRLLYNV